jgi:hypothetical protein
MYGEGHTVSVTTSSVKIRLIPLRTNLGWMQADISILEVPGGYIHNSPLFWCSPAQPAMPVCLSEMRSLRRRIRLQGNTVVARGGPCRDLRAGSIKDLPSAFFYTKASLIVISG